MKIVYSDMPLPRSVTRSIFLAGPSPRTPDTPSWRPQALEWLKKRGYTGYVFYPERSDGVIPHDVKLKAEHLQWEDEAMDSADIILFWIPRDMTIMPGLATNTEFGTYAARDHSRVVLGAPEGAQQTSYQFAIAQRRGIPCYHHLSETIDKALEMIGTGAPRFGADCNVPLHIWTCPSFQHWYQLQLSLGNELQRLRVEWASRNNRDAELRFELLVDIYVASENRLFTNEPVSSTQMTYHPTAERPMSIQPPAEWLMSFPPAAGRLRIA